ncbi:amidase [uncultured Jatrophihabitans sp.]|uniref:amidase n=1 Tax=uncultured Jatrophihabitans sp. TaxID=1610747 RepID=UPI0035CB09F1
MDAFALAASISSGTSSAVEAVTTSLSAIEARDGKLNAFTVVLADEALQRAADVDSGAVTGPLAGVPISVKDHVWVKGLLSTNGSRALETFVAPETCVAVQRLLDAGAIIVGKTNNPEFCYRGHTANDLYGATRNPHDPTRTAGGSSGGAAVSVATGAVPLAVGTDGGGSIRIPSAFCGTYGIKPSFGLVPKLPGFRGWPTLSVTGPIAASVRDLALALQVMGGPAGADWLSFPTLGTPDYLAAVDAPTWRGLKVAVSEDLGFSDVDPDVRAAFRTAVDAAVAAGAELVESTPPADNPVPLWDAVALPEGYASEGRLVEEQRALVGDDAAAITLAGRSASALDYLDAQEDRAAYARRWSGFFADVDVLLTPALPITAFALGRIGPETIDGASVPDGFDAWCALALPANLAGLPSACVPIGADRNGLPIAAQVMGGRWTDAVVLRGAALLDAAVRGS